MVYEGYGLTETSPIATANWPGSRRIGSVGRAFPGVRVAVDLAAEDFTQENGMLTPKLSVRRRVVEQRWGKELQNLYT